MIPDTNDPNAAMPMHPAQQHQSASHHENLAYSVTFIQHCTSRSNLLKVSHA